MRAAWLLVCLVACKRPPTVDVVADAAAPVVSASAPKPVMPPAGAAGFVYLTTKQLVAIDPEGGVSVIKPVKGEVENIVRSGDGRAWALIQTSYPALDVARIDGKALTVVATLEECAPRRYAFDARGEHLVIKCFDGTFEKNGPEWVNLGLDRRTLEESVWISKNGTVWYGDEKTLAERRDGKWIEYKIDGGIGRPDAWFEGPTFTNRSTLYRFADGKVDVVYSFSGRKGLIHAASNGLFGYADAKTISWNVIDGSLKTFPSDHRIGNRAALDDTGRVWDIRDGELSLTTPEGTSTVPMGAYAELDGIGVLSDLVVLGAGAKIPPAKPVRHTKKITGTVTFDGKPMASAKVQLCPRMNGLYEGDSPCADANPNVVLNTTTDAKGAFSIENVPMGIYFLHYKSPDRDRWSIDSSELKLIENGVTNLGTLAYVPN